MEIMFNNAQEFNKYKPIRNFIRKFPRLELLKYSIEYSLYISRGWQDERKLEYVKKYPHPWEVLLLGRMIIHDWNNINGSHEITPDLFHEIINMIRKDIIPLKEFPSYGGAQNISKFMRRNVSPQIVYQNEINTIQSGRALELLVKSQISSSFENIICDLKISEFFDILILSWAPFLEGKTSIVSNYFSSIPERLKFIEKSKKLFDYLSINEAEIDNFNDAHPLVSLVEELSNKPTFYTKPFFNINGNYYLWSVALLEEMIRFGVYDILKKQNSQKFGNKFGPIFENYIRKRLDNYEIDYIDEKKLKQEGFHNQVDFLIQSGQDVIAIEAKSIESCDTATNDPSNENMIYFYKKNAIKALAQSHYVIKELEKNQSINNVFLIVVTYKELYFGNGEDCWEEFLKEGLRKKYKVEDFKINPGKLFFISIKDFDRLLHCARYKNIFSILNEIFLYKEKSRSMADKKFLFGQYLKDIVPKYNINEDTFLEEIFNSYHDDMLRKYFPESVQD